MSVITYQYGKETNTIEIGKQYGVKREGNCIDICLSRAIAHDCPVTVAILIRTNGDVVLWYTEFDGNKNTYWHFSNGTDAMSALTVQQIDTIDKMHRGEITLPGNLRGSLGEPVIRWALGGRSARIASAYHD